MIKIPDIKLVDLLSKYIPGDGETPAGGDNLKNMYQNLQNPEMLIPVLGLQGVGKSTLINGILKENIMPNEADETTCIPVEVRYADTPSVYIHFLDGKSRSILKNEICQYVDNNYNKGNEKQVSHIVIYRNIELLKTGIVLVDLPGVGSMTNNNQETTNEYRKKLYSAIFVIRVNPPITRTEAIFIKVAWNTLSNAWFVQNRWNNENDREVTEGLDANETILKDIAEKTQIPYNGEIITINAYQALVGVTQNKPENLQASNIPAITDKLSMIHSNWKEQTEIKYFEKALNIIAIVKIIINDQLEKCKLTKEELTEKLHIEEAEFEKNTADIKKQVSEVEDILDSQKIEASSFIKKLFREAEENIRANINRVIDGGVTDGEDLTQAFNDYQLQEFEMINDGYTDFIGEKTREISVKMVELSDMIKQDQKNNFTAEVFSKQQELKWEKGLEVGIKIGGGIGGVAVGLKAGAAAGSLIAPPIGTIVGGLAGAAAMVLVGIFSGMIGEGSKKLKMADRATATKRQISPIIEDVCEKMQKQLIKSFNTMCDDIGVALEQYCKDRLLAAQKSKEENMKILQQDKNSDELAQELTKDLSYLIEQEVQFRV
jgi:hypothetical protein